MRRSIVAGLALMLALVLAPARARGQQGEPSLAGQVLDATTRAPIRAGVVELTPGNRRFLTDSLGRFRIPGLRPGRYAIVASALGYQKTVGSAEPGVPALLLLAPEPVPLRAIEALAQPSRRTVRGIPQWVFGRAQLLSGGDISAAEFVRWKVPMTVRPCQTFDWGPIMTTTIAPLGGEAGGRRVPVPMATPFREGAPEGLLGHECIYGSSSALDADRLRGRSGFRVRPGPFMVMVDGRPASGSEELWSYRAYDLGRVEVMYQRSPSAAMSTPFALVRVYTTGYLARVAARTGDACQRARSAAAGSSADSALAALCGP